MKNIYIFILAMPRVELFSAISPTAVKSCEEITTSR